MGDSFTHLHLHTEFSMLDGAARVKEVVAAAAADGQPAIGITDHGNMYGILDFYKACRDVGITPVLGTEAYMAGETRFERPPRRGRVDDTGGDTEGGQKLYYHLTLLAESDAGYRNLIKLSSQAFLDGYYYKPRCLLPGQEIVTRSGVKAIEEIVPGDEVLTHRGRFRKVLRTMSRDHDGDIYGIRLAGRYERTTWMTGEHPVLVRDGAGGRSWVEARDVVGGRPAPGERASNWSSWVCLPKPVSDAPMVDTIRTAEHVDWEPVDGSPGTFRRTVHRTRIGPTYHDGSLPDEIPLDYDVGYFLGLYVAEGWTSGNEVSWAFHRDEQELIDRCVVMAEKLSGHAVTVDTHPARADYGGVTVRCHSTLLAQLLRSLCGTGARNKRLPTFVFEAPLGFQQGIVDGVLDGDGSINDSCIIFTQTSRDLAWQVRMLRAALDDDFACVTKRELPVEQHATQYRSTFSPRRPSKFRHTQADSGFVYKPIREVVTRHYSGPVFNIEVEDDHSYVSDFTIHNCDWELLDRHSEGVIATTGCLGGHVLQALLQGDEKGAVEKAARLQDIFGRDNLFVELQDHGLAAQKQTNPQLIAIAKKIQAPLLATNDSHYTHQADHVAHDALLCVQTGALRDDPNRFKFEGDQHYLKSAAEMRQLFRDHPEACDNTLWIAERANVEIEFGKPKLPTFPLPEGHADADDYLRHLAFEGAKERYGDGTGQLPEVVVDRLMYELSVISQMGFSDYFLIVWDLIRFARERRIRVGPGRGSAAGCCVAYCLRIVDLDPIKYDLLFERFLNPGRRQMPDIDMDFDDRYRGDMIKYATERYGWDHVAQIITFSTIKARAAVRDAARVLGYPYVVGDKIAKAMPPLVMGRDTPLYACFEQTPKFEDGYKAAGELRDMYATDPDAKAVIDVARGLEGLRRQDSIHAAAVVITDEPLTEYLPIQRKPEPGGSPEDAPIVTQYEMHGVEELGLLKMDFLGLRNLSVIEQALDLIAETTGERPDIDDIPLDDDAALELLRKGDSIGVFQLEGGPMRALMRSLAPTSFDDVAALVALYRPGPMAANMHNDYADRKNGRKPITYLHPDLEEILADTQGLMIYQESMMRVAQKFAGYTLEEADNLRKACFPAGTKMLTKARGYVPIERIMGLSDRRVQTVDTTSCTTRFEAVEDVWSVGVKPVYRLTTSTGYSIEATANHPFLVEDEWRELGQIEHGDLVAVAARTATDGGSKISVAEIELAALLISEGYTPDLTVPGLHRCAFFCNTDPELVETFRAAFETHFGYAHTRAAVVGGVTRLRLTKAELLALKPALGTLGVSEHKTISSRIVNAPLHKVERFLGLYFCADGWADRSGVHFASKSKPVCLALKRMLLRFGIVSNLHKRRIDGHGDHWTLSVADKGKAKAFAQLVEPHLTEVKAAKVDRWLREWPDGASATNIGIPSSFLRAEVERRKDVTAKSARALGVDSGGYTTSRVLHRDTLNGLLYSERLEDLRTGDLVWDTVVSVEYVGEVECFDFRMANPERPYAVVEDFLAHNCGKKIRELLAKEREKFVAGCESTGYGAEIGTKLFDIIEPFADYAFNKSHSYGYGFVAYQTAWLKAHHPVEYLAALLTSVKNNLDKAAVYLNECRQMGIQVLVPDVNVSQSDFTARGQTIPFGLSAVRNVGEGLVGLILEEREKNGPFTDFYEFCERVDTGVLNKRTIESLIKAGAFDSMGHPRRGLLEVFEQIVDQTCARRRERDMGVMTLFGEAAPGEGPAFDERPKIRDVEFEKRQRLAFEKEMLGLYVSDHPLMGAEGALRRRTDCSINDLRDANEEGAMRTVGGVVTALQRKYTKKGDLMAVFMLEDLQSAIEVMVFPKTMLDHGYKLAEDRIVCVKGRLDAREDLPKIIAMDIEPFEPVTDGAPPVRINLPPVALSERVIDKLHRVLKEHPGESQVFLHLGERKVLRLPDEFCVDAGNGLVGELREMLGAGAVLA